MLGFPRSAHQTAVDEFMMKAGQAVPTKPTELSDQDRLLRAKLIYEEAMETIYFGLGVALKMVTEDGSSPEFYIPPGIKQNIEHIIDGCCDLKVVTTGTLSAIGIPDVRFQKLVDDNNLQKFGPGGYRNEAGKWIKPPSHQPPAINGMLIELEGFLSE